LALTTTLTVRRDPAVRLGEDRVRLLEAIRDEGSIAAAARRVGLSYKGAWDAVNALNNLFDRPLVAARPGGRAGGGAGLTPEGEDAVRALTMIEAELTAAVGRLERHLGRGAASLPSLLWSLSMRTSARNALRGVVAAVTDGPVNASVALTVSDSVTITAVITRESVADLGLSPGVPAVALIKSSFVILAPGANPPRTSARNALSGTIAAVSDGAVSSEVALDIGGGKTIVAVITRESADEFGLAVGDPATALVKASHVILAVD
jgi:molybdate transport system regulatory protein